MVGEIETHVGAIVLPAGGAEYGIQVQPLGTQEFGWRGLGDILPILSGSRVLRVVGPDAKAEDGQRRARQHQGFDTFPVSLLLLNNALASVDSNKKQFDVIILSADLGMELNQIHPASSESQSGLLAALARLLAPGGFIYVEAQNRFDWRRLKEAVARRGRPHARGTCRTYRGYRHLFRTAGLSIRNDYLIIRQKQETVAVLPLEHKAALNTYLNREWVRDSDTPRDRLFNRIKECLASPLFWRAFGPQFGFVLEKGHA